MKAKIITVDETEEQYDIVVFDADVTYRGVKVFLESKGVKIQDKCNKERIKQDVLFRYESI